MGVMVATTMATMPMEETTTAATTVAMVALLQATMAMAATEAALLVVSLWTAHIPCHQLGSMSLHSNHNNAVHASLCKALMVSKGDSLPCYCKCYNDVS